MDLLGFIPNRAAQSLSSGHNHTIGLLVPDIRNSFFAELARGVEDRAHESGFSVVLGSTDFDHEREQRYLNLIRSRALDGLVYAAGAPPKLTFLLDIEREVPLVLADEEVPGFDSALVMADHFEGGRLVAQYLAALGHSQVLVISGPRELASSVKRLTGFEEGFGSGHFDIHVGDFREGSGSNAIEAQDNPKRFAYTAVFALNDLMAVGAIRALEAVGKRVPEDVSVIGFDDIALARLVNPTLTTVSQPAYRIGHFATARLLEAVEAGQRPSQFRHLLDVDLVVRASSAARHLSEAIVG